jgi:hypothetical protein
LRDKAELFDNNHTVVVACPKAIHFRQSQSWGGLTCIINPGKRPVIATLTRKHQKARHLDLDKLKIDSLRPDISTCL